MAGLEGIGRGRDWARYLARLTPILELYLILALYRIDQQSLWVDEVGSGEAAAIAAIRSRVLQMALLSAVLFGNGLALHNCYFNPRYDREVARAAARFLEAVSQPWRDV